MHASDLYIYWLATCKIGGARPPVLNWGPVLLPLQWNEVQTHLCTVKHKASIGNTCQYHLRGDGVMEAIAELHVYQSWDVCL